jgi:hypothetical protein
MIKKIDDELYQVVCSWWKDRGWPQIPRVMLPDRGYVSFVADVPVAAAFLYKDESAAFGMIEWAISDPFAQVDTRSNAIDEVIAYIVNEANKIGIKLLFTSLKNKSLLERYKKNYFNVSDTEMTNMVRFM